MAKKKNQSNNNEKEINNDDGNVTVVLKIDMHCEGCAVKIVKSVQSIEGVESVMRRENDWKKITVVGKVDPVELRENVDGKLNRMVELISPATKQQTDGNEEQKKQKKQQADDGKDDSKHKKLPVTTTVLKVPLHCRGCIKKIQKLVRKTEGFMDMSIDKSNNLVTVKGAMDIKLLTAELHDKLKKKAEIVPTNDGGGKKAKSGDGKKTKGGGGDKERKKTGGGGPTMAGYNYTMEYYGGQGEYMYPQYVNRAEYTYNYMHATQMFNDENPNACIVM
ncbi:hypothetical protein QVD17_11361 [Tagetes erecta]|uniref:HMA domain-containing protein n=1 Tax=Tagetes erecta TaxID=13708 RepID=A0AAD8KX60_TARER|nr:hypothetical protein QVD17_11361 [Tagetes erecta]